MNTREEAAAFVREHLGKAFEVVSAAYQEERRRKEEVWKAADDACEAFFADVRERRSRVRAQIKNMEQRKVQIGTEKEQLQQNLMQAIADGNSGVAEEKRQQLTTLEAELMAIPGQIDALRAMNIPGNETLYKAALDAYARYGEYMDVGILDGISGTASEIFDQIGRCFQFGEFRPPVSNGIAFIPGSEYALTKSVEKMEGWINGTTPTSIEDDDRRSGINRTFV